MLDSIISFFGAILSKIFSRADKPSENSGIKTGDINAGGGVKIKNDNSSKNTRKRK